MTRSAQERLIKELRDELNQVTIAHNEMRRQRDEARVEICHLLSNNALTAPHIAKSREWNILFLT